MAKVFRMPVTGTGSTTDPYRAKHGKHWGVLFYSKDRTEVVVLMDDDDPDGIAAAEKDPTCTALKSDKEIETAKADIISKSGGLF